MKLRKLFRAPMSSMLFIMDEINMRFLIWSIIHNSAIKQRIILKEYDIPENSKLTQQNATLFNF